MKFIEEPTNCPCCDYKLEKIKDQLFCRNTACSAQCLKKIEHFAKVLKIKGLGPKTIEKLQLAEITELFYLDEAEVYNTLGEKIGIKLLEEIEKAKRADVATVLESFSIPLVGGTAAAKLAKVINTPADITVDKCKEAGLGEKVTENIITWVNTEYKELEEFLPFTYTKSSVATGDKVCITGKLKNFKKKADAEELLLAAGYVLTDSVTKDTKYLVDENNSTSSKRSTAEKYGITIITDLNDLLKDKDNK